MSGYNDWATTMGLYLHLYIGPYARATFSVKETQHEDVKDRNVCVNPQCKEFHQKTQKKHFCPDCGQPTAPIQFTNRHTKREATVPTFHYDLMDEAGLREDALDEIRRWHESTNDLTKWDLKEHWYTPDDSKRRLRKFVYMSEDLADLHLGILDHQAEMAWFEEAYKTELDVLRRVYDSVTIDWAITTWQS